MDALGSLRLDLRGVSLVPHRLTTGSGWTREATVVVFEGGDGSVGSGEDVTYEAVDQHAFRENGVPSAIARGGAWRLDAFCRLVGTLDTFGPAEPTRAVNRRYRRWAFESAALDLALRQNGLSLADALGRTPRPLRYVVSGGLGASASLEPLERVRALHPGVEFKVDFASDWTLETVDALAEFGGITTVDFKAHYHGSFEGPAPDAALYRAVAERLPDAWLEDPAWEGEAWDALRGFRDRVTWDAVLHSVAEIEALPEPPRAINIKPSRFGSLEELFAVYDWCERRSVAAYGGGQFELDVGRRQIQALASLFHAGGPNDVSPVDFHRDVLDGTEPASPLQLEKETPGFG